MKERQISTENMGFFRRSADRLVGIANIIDVIAIVYGIVFSKFNVAIAGGVSFLGGKLLQKELRKQPA